MIHFCWISAVRYEDKEARWQVERALEGEWECWALVAGVTCLPQYQGWAASLWASSFYSMTYLNLRPSDAEDEITTYKKAISHLDSVYLETLFQHLPN